MAEVGVNACTDITGYGLLGPGILYLNGEVCCSSGIVDYCEICDGPNMDCNPSDWDNDCPDTDCDGECFGPNWPGWCEDGVRDVIALN